MILASPLLAGFDWLEHGFGTRAGPLSQDGMATLKQVHSSTVLRAHGTAACIGEGDALLSHVGTPVSIRTADCLPILLADPVNRAVAAVHAGWRGSAARIVQAAIDRMCAEFGTDASELRAAIGPGIGVCCYEVGVDVARQFGMDGAGHLDLAAENREQMLVAGVPESHIEVLAFCTRCDALRFHSYRRDGEAAGRMISYIGVKSSKRDR
jgi:YfiH family protein